MERVVEEKYTTNILNEDTILLTVTNSEFHPQSLLGYFKKFPLVSRIIVDEILLTGGGTRRFRVYRLNGDNVELISRDLKELSVNEDLVINAANDFWKKNPKLAHELPISSSYLNRIVESSPEY